MGTTMILYSVPVLGSTYFAQCGWKEKGTDSVEPRPSISPEYQPPEFAALFWSALFGAS